MSFTGQIEMVAGCSLKGASRARKGFSARSCPGPRPRKWGLQVSWCRGFSAVPLERVSRELATVQAGRAPTVIWWLMPQIDVFLSLVSWSPLVTAAALQEAHLFGELI